jgi:hypothetical protein
VSQTRAVDFLRVGSVRVTKPPAGVSIGVFRPDGRRHPLRRHRPNQRFLRQHDQIDEIEFRRGGNVPFRKQSVGDIAQVGIGKAQERKRFGSDIHPHGNARQNVGNAGMAAEIPLQNIAQGTVNLMGV